jgi:hypothetical protein
MSAGGASIRTVVLNCPAWCTSHTIDIDSNDEFGGFTIHTTPVALTTNGQGGPPAERHDVEVEVERATRLSNGEVVTDFSSGGPTYVVLREGECTLLLASPAEVRALAAALTEAADLADASS